VFTLFNTNARSCDVMAYTDSDWLSNTASYTYS